MDSHIWIQLTLPMQANESVVTAGDKTILAKTWMNTECKRIRAKGGHAHIHPFGEKGSAIFVRIHSEFRAGDRGGSGALKSLSEVERKITEEMERDGEVEEGR